MSYDISFKVKVEGVDAYVPVGACDANITWSARKIIEKSTRLKWKNCQNNGLCVDVIPKIEAGLRKLEQKPLPQLRGEDGWRRTQMSDKYILRSGAIDAIKRNAGTLYTREAESLFRKVISLLKNAPAADVAPVVHGKCDGNDCTVCKLPWNYNFEERRFECLEEQN